MNVRHPPVVRWWTVLLIPAFAWLAISAGPQCLSAADELFPAVPAAVKTTEWTVSPAKEPAPALKYQFLPSFVDSIPGNAATYYYRAALMSQPIRNNLKLMDQIGEWSEMPIAQLPRNEVHTLLQNQQRLFGELQSASRCSQCDWGLRIQDLKGPEVFDISLEEYSDMRLIGRLLRLKAKLEIAEGKFEDAIATIRQTYQLAHHLTSVPVVIVNLISLAIQSIASECVADLISADGSPNVYWALRGLPDSINDVQAALRCDGSTAFRLFPFLKDPESQRLTPEEWQKKLTDAISLLDSYQERHGMGEIGNRIRLASVLVQGYSTAKQALIDSGYDSQRVETMPVGQVIAIYARDCHQHVVDEYAKWSLVSYEQGYAKSKLVTQKLYDEGYLISPQSVIPERDPLLINTRLGHISVQLVDAVNRQRRVLMGLAAIEAIRMQVAESNGKLPESLDKITIVPVPVNPATGQPFPYRVVDQRAELYIPPTPAMDWTGRRFFIRMKATRP